MMMHKKLQKILAVALMTSFFSTSFIMGVSEAAPARQAGGQRPAQAQQYRPVPKSSSGQQARPHMQQGTHRQQSRPMQRGSSNHQSRPSMQQGAPRQQSRPLQRNTGHQGPAIHKNGPAHQGPVMHKGQPMNHKGGSIHQGPGMHKGRPLSHKGGSIHHGPAVHRNGPHHKGQPVMHKSGPYHDHGGPVVVQQHHPAPPPYDHGRDHRSMHSEDWLGALIVGGIIGAIIANSSHHTNNVNNVEYAEVY